MNKRRALTPEEKGEIFGGMGDSGSSLPNYKIWHDILPEDPRRLCWDCKILFANEQEYNDHMAKCHSNSTVLAQ